MTKKIRGQVDGWRYLDVRCDECGTAMRPADVRITDIARDGSWSNLQAAGGLLVELHGYYGGFADQLPNERQWQVLLCSDCAARLLASFGSLRHLVHRSVSKNLAADRALTSLDEELRPVDAPCDNPQTETER